MFELPFERLGGLNREGEMKPRPFMIGLFVLLLASATLNAYLLARGPDPESIRLGQQQTEPPNQSIVPEKVIAPKQVSSAAAVPSSTSRDSASAQSCDARLSDVRAELDKAQRQIDLYVPPNVRFDTGRPDPRAADRLRPQLQRIFETDGGTLHWTVECRSQVCKLHLISAAGAERDWSAKLQADDSIRRMRKGMSFHAGAPTNDPLTGEALFEEEAYVSLGPEQEDTRSGLDIGRQLVERFRSSDAVRACTNGFRISGTLEARIDVEEAGRFSYRFGGTLGATPAGRCIAERLQEMASTVALPQLAQGGVVFATFRSPPE
jgi:hypothetical protein